jgi:hypothetical protein
MVKISVDEVTVELDFSNTFDCLREDILPKTVAEELLWMLLSTSG